LNVLHTELAKQLADTMVLPLIQFREKDLTGKPSGTSHRSQKPVGPFTKCSEKLAVKLQKVTAASHGYRANAGDLKTNQEPAWVRTALDSWTEVSTLKDLFLLASNEHDLSMAKYSRLPKKRENEKLKAEVAKEVAGARRKQHLSSLQYYCALNALQYRKRTAMLDPILGYTQGQINFFKKGFEMFSKKMDEFLSSVTNMIQRIQGELETEADAMRISQQELLSGNDAMYTPDYDVTSPIINRNLIQKAGYLNMRSLGHLGKNLALRRKDEHYHQSCVMQTVKHPETIHASFTRGMRNVRFSSFRFRMKNGHTCIPVERRMSEMTCPLTSDLLRSEKCNGGKPYFSIHFRIGLSDDGHYGFKHFSKTGLVTTTWERLYFFTQGGNLMCQHRGEVAGGLIKDLDNCSVMAVDCEDRRYCFQITSPSGKTSIILQAEGKREYEEWICAINNISRQIYLTDNPEAVAISESLRQNVPQREPTNHVTEDGTEELQPEQLIVPGTPIQFDIVLPATEFQDQNRGNRRTNPFGESEDTGENPAEEGLLLQQMFVVRFLGSMAVKSDHTNKVIFEAMRQVLAARAIHNIFRMTESHLMVTSKSIRLIDPQTQVTRISVSIKRSPAAPFTRNPTKEI
ncbi:hypothetical protein AB205_0128870, partial [Aquarana catesbeiana]